METTNERLEQHRDDFEEMYQLSMQLLNRIEARVQRHESFCSSFKDYGNKFQEVNKQYSQMLKELEGKTDNAGNGGNV